MNFFEETGKFLVEICTYLSRFIQLTTALISA